MKNKTKLRYDEIMERPCCRDMSNRKGIEETFITFKNESIPYIRNKCKVCGQRWVTTKEKLFNK